MVEDSDFPYELDQMDAGAHSPTYTEDGIVYPPGHRPPDNFGFDDGEDEGDEPHPLTPPHVAASTTDTLQPPSPDEAYAQRLSALERRLQTTEDLNARLIGPALDRTVEPQPPKSRDQLETVEDLLQYIEWQNKQAQAQQTAAAEQSARHAALEAQARGVFSTQTMGEGWDYDAVVSRRMAPLLQSSPNLRQLLMTQENPALAAYFLSVMMEVVHQNGGDVVKAARSMIQSSSAGARASKELTQRLNSAARAAAERVSGGTGSGDIGAGKYPDFSRMSDQQFDAWERRMLRREG
jgi:hypothetical protein